tara:strand:- start:724 stop:1605 length:882 start_codon:yes stop_codon:yes gene_type:complete
VSSASLAEVAAPVVRLKTRSIVFDVFGSYIRYKGGAVAIRDMASILSWFGVTEEATRVTMSRMRREGWFTSRRHGRNSYYELSDRAWTLLQQGRRRIFDRNRDAWRGEWHILLLKHDANSAVERERTRRELAWRGYVPLAASTWIGARDETDGLRETLAEGVHLQGFAARTPFSQDDREFAAQHWDLDELVDDYRSFLRRYESLAAEATLATLSDEEVLVRRTVITHEYRMFPYRDPDLPSDLLPNDWPGYEAHGLFLHIVEALKDRSWAAFDRVCDRPTPASNRTDASRTVA